MRPTALASADDSPSVVTFSLEPRMFRKRTAEIAAVGGMRAIATRAASGIAILRIEHDLGRIDVLPFHGQQVWDAVFRGRRLTMTSTFREPVSTREYMANNGAYLIHCGGSAMGSPGPTDKHAPHGEMPNARHRNVHLMVELGSRVAMTVRGGFEYQRAFGAYFAAETAITMAEGSSLLESEVRINNRSAEPRPLMYLAHLNFRPAINGKIVDLPPLREPAFARKPVRVSGPGFQRVVGVEELQSPEFLIDDLLRDQVRVDPELVQGLAGASRAPRVLTAQVHSDGSADLVEQASPDLSHIVRWMRRSADDDAFGFALPATAHAEGLDAETRKGNVRLFAHGEGIVAAYRHGMVADWGRFATANNLT